MRTKPCATCGVKIVYIEGKGEAWWAKRMYCSRQCVRMGKSPWNKGVKTGIKPTNGFQKGSHQNKGVVRTEEQKKRHSETMKKLFKDGMPIWWREAICKGHGSKGDNRNGWKIRLWRKEIHKKYNYSCIFCGEKSEIAHHIKSRKEWKDGIYDLNNGVALCRACHAKLHWKNGTYDERVEKQRIQ